MRNTVSSSIGSDASTSRWPYVDRCAMRPSRATRHSHPGSRPSSTYLRKWVSMRASRPPSNPASSGATSTFSSGTPDPLLLVSKETLLRGADRQPGAGHGGLGLGDGELAEVEDRRGQHGVGPAVARSLDEVLERAHSPAGDDRNPGGLDHLSGQLQLEAVLGAVTVHGREQDLARPETLGLGRPRHRVEPRGLAPAVRVHL